MSNNKKLLLDIDQNGDGVITNAEMDRAKELADYEHQLRMQENENAKEDQMRKMAWFALWGMLLYPIGIIASNLFDLAQAGELLSDIAPTYFMSISGLVAAFFGAEAYKKAKSNGTNH